MVYGDPKTQKCRTCFQGGPPCPKWLACHCPLPAMPAQHTPGPGGRGRRPRENSAQCQLQSASRSRLPWQREGGGGGAESLWKAGMCVFLPWSQILPALPNPCGQPGRERGQALLSRGPPPQGPGTLSTRRSVLPGGSSAGGLSLFFVARAPDVLTGHPGQTDPPDRL